MASNCFDNSLKKKVYIIIIKIIDCFASLQKEYILVDSTKLVEPKTIIKTDDSKQSNMSDKSNDVETFLKTCCIANKDNNIAISPIKKIIQKYPILQ